MLILIEKTQITQFNITKEYKQVIHKRGSLDKQLICLSLLVIKLLQI